MDDSCRLRDIQGVLEKERSLPREILGSDKIRVSPWALTLSRETAKSEFQLRRPWKELHLLLSSLSLLRSRATRTVSLNSNPLESEIGSRVQKCLENIPDNFPSAFPQHFRAATRRVSILSRSRERNQISFSVNWKVLISFVNFSPAPRASGNFINWLQSPRRNNT